MLVQPKKAIGTRALLDPEIPGAKLLPDGKWAINRAAALLNFPALGLKVQVPVWSNKDLGDKVELLLNNVPVDQQTVTQPAEQTQRTTLFVAPGRFQTGAWALAYRVTRVAQQPEPFAPPLQLAVKLEIPAGQDTNPEQGHSNLHMAFRPPEIVQDGVDKDTADKGVDIVVNAVPGSGSDLPYPDIAVGDVIIASWGGKLVASAPVTQAQIDDPLNNPIVVHISKDIILAAGDSGNEGLAVSFFVRDFVDNDSEDWCKEARIVVDTGNSRLDAPILKQADGNELDLDQLGNEQLLLQVVAASSVDFKLGDIIIMHLQGTTLDGDPVEVDARQRVDKNPPLVVEVPMDNDGARALAKTQGVFFFDLERDGRIIQRSRGRFINMKGEPKRLAAPIVESAVSGALDPDLANVIVRFPFDPLITEHNAIELLWSITLADGTVFEPELDWIFPTLQEANDPDGFIVIISGPDYLKPGEGGTLKVSYNLLSEGENDEVIRRPSLPAAPLNIGEPRLELVPPILLGEQDGALEPKDLPNGISEVTCPNPVNNPTLPKDVVHWQLHDASNKLLFEDHKPLNALSAGKPVKFPLNAAFVQQYFEARRGEQLSVRYHIVRDATDKISYSNPLVFVVGNSHSVKLTVVGNRSQTSPRYHSNLSRLTASSLINGRINSPTEAVWMYAGDTEGARAQSFLDNEPEKPLIVSLLDDENIIARTVLRPGNVSGIFNLANRHSGCIIKDDGSVFGWSDNTEMLPPSELKDVRYVAAGGHAFAALKKDDTVVAWGATSLGGYIAPETEKKLTNVGKLAATDGAFVALRNDGQLVAWGNPEYGGSIPVSAISELGPARRVIGNTADFTVLLVDGRVFSWGASWPEGFWVSGAHGATQLCASDRAFCALNADRSVVAWGSPEHGGVMPGRTHNSAEEVVLVTSTSAAFAALRSDGTVIAWGNQRFGGETPSGLQSVSHLSGSTTAFCALKTDGSLFAWGVSEEGGQIPEGLAPALSIASSYGSFSAVLTTHRAVSWGVNTSSTQLQSVACAYAAGPHLVLLSADRQLQSAGPNAPDLKALSGLVSYNE